MFFPHKIRKYRGAAGVRLSSARPGAQLLRGDQLCAGRVPDPERKDRGAGETSVRQLTTEEPSDLQQILTRLEQLERRVADTDFFSRSASGRRYYGQGSRCDWAEGQFWSRFVGSARLLCVWIDWPHQT